MRVIKFGGSSVADAARIRAVARIIARHHAEVPVTVVVSAMGGVTDALLDVAGAALAGSDALLDVAGAALAGSDAWRGPLADIERRHRAAYRALHVPVPPVFAAQWAQLLGAIAALRKEGAAPGSARAEALAARFSGWGERLIVGIVAGAVNSSGTLARACAEEPVLLDGAAPLAHPSILATRAWLVPQLAGFIRRGGVPILPGYIARDATGRGVTLGRNGSDHSATVIAAALGADGVMIYSDVAGVYTADPHIVRGARLVPALTYADAAAVSMLGARVIHPRTVEPLDRWQIPLRLRDYRTPDAPGTDILPAARVPGLALGTQPEWIVAARPLRREDADTYGVRVPGALVEVTGALLGMGDEARDNTHPALAAMARALRGEIAPVGELMCAARQVRVVVPASESVAVQRRLHAALAALLVPNHETCLRHDHSQPQPNPPNPLAFAGRGWRAAPAARCGERY